MRKLVENTLKKLGQSFQVLPEILEGCFYLFKSQPPFHNYRSFVLSVQSFSTFGNVRNNSLTSQHGELEISSSGFQLARKSAVFRVFPAVFGRLLVTQQRRRNSRRLVHKMTNKIFLLMLGQFCLLLRSMNHLHFGISLVKNSFRS